MENCLVAPYAFKGTLTSKAAAEAIAEGIVRAGHDAMLTLLPLGDGGTGTLDALMTALGGEMRSSIRRNALEEDVECRWGAVPQRRAVIEAAEVIALADVPPSLRDPSSLTTVGLGELIAVALDSNPVELIIGLGDTATHDCGMGVGAALGYRFLDDNGRTLEPVGRSLPHLAAIDASHARTLTEGLAIRIFCDVLNPLLGPDGAALRFAGQKGADAPTIERLEEGSRRFAKVVRRDLGRDVAGIPGAGAAGGLGAGLAAFCRAQLLGGAEGVLDTVGFDRLAAGSDLVITGEGRLDAKTLLGKGIMHIARRTAQAGGKLLIVTGSVEGEKEWWKERLSADIIETGSEPSSKDAAETLVQKIMNAEL